MEGKILLEVKDLKKYYIPRGRKKAAVRAVDGVSFQIPAGTTYGLVGESGCGKTTVGKTILHLAEATGGQILLDGQDIVPYRGKELRRLWMRVQMIFQDPFSSMDPKKAIYQIVAEPHEGIWAVPGKGSP